MKASSYFPELERAVSEMNTTDAKSLKKVRVKLEKKCNEIAKEDKMAEQDEMNMSKWVSWAQSRILWIQTMERYDDSGSIGNNRR